MKQLPPKSTRTYKLFPYTTLCRSKVRPKHLGLSGFSCEHDTTGGGARWEQDPPAKTAEFQRDACLRRGFAVAASGTPARAATAAPINARLQRNREPHKNNRHRDDPGQRSERRSNQHEKRAHRGSEEQNHQRERKRIGEGKSEYVRNELE